MAQKRGFNEGKRHFKKSKKQKTTTTSISDGSSEDVLLVDIQSLLPKLNITEDQQGQQELPREQTEIDITITDLSSTGDGLGVHDNHIYVVPFSAPGDVVTAKPYHHHPAQHYSLADFVRVVTPSPHRTEVPPCPYFSRCSGCQFQYLPYDYQLQHKRRVVEKAFRNFSNLPASSVPAVGETVGSPLQYGYRTKLTPHFDGPPGGRRDKRNRKAVTWPEVPPIGFMKKGTRKTMDIEDCPIGTDAVRLGMKRERERVAENINAYQKGATLLLRESTRRVPKGEDVGEDNTMKEDVKQDTIPENDKNDNIQEDVKKDTIHENVKKDNIQKHVKKDTIHEEHVIKTCITNQKAISTEYVDDFRLDNPAGAFFQNNNSILPLVTQYIRDHILGPVPGKVKNMIDAYCGSGLFTVTLSQAFTQSIGIDISAQSIDFASKNASLNSLPESSTHFIAADANHLFAAVDTQKFKPEETAVIVDPPRKGCDVDFVRQLLRYAPERICYVSCNVHTQARDVGWLVGGLPGGKGGEGGYEIESVRGFDFFPMTSHVEGVAILRRKKDRAGATVTAEEVEVGGETGGDENLASGEVQS